VPNVETMHGSVDDLGSLTNAQAVDHLDPAEFLHARARVELRVPAG
jgi:hypothetical protein